MFRLIAHSPFAPLLLTVWDGYEVGRRFGVVPFLPVSGDRYVSQTFEEPMPFREPTPEGLPSNVIWDTNPPFPKRMNKIMRIPGGAADNQGFVFDGNGRPIDCACHAVRQMLKYRWRQRRNGIAASYMRDADGPKSVPGTVFVATATSQHCYYHWMFDVLPRLGRSIELMGPDDKLYIQAGRHRYQRETLEFFDRYRDRIIDADAAPWITADELVVPSHQILNGYHYIDWVLQWLRKSFPSNATASGEQNGRKLFISRSSAQTRRIVNEDEVFGLLEPLGFEYFQSEHHSFQEQVDAFSTATAVIAPHGAGLTNIVFSRPGINVIELFPSRSVDAYHRLSVEMAHRYAFVKSLTKRRKRRANEDFVVNMDHLRQILAQAGLSSS